MYICNTLVRKERYSISPTLAFLWSHVPIVTLEPARAAEFVRTEGKQGSLGRVDPSLTQACSTCCMQTHYWHEQFDSSKRGSVGECNGVRNPTFVLLTSKNTLGSLSIAPGAIGKSPPRRDAPGTVESGASHETLQSGRRPL